MSVLFEVPELTTKRLRMRLPTMADFEAFASFRSSGRSQFVGGPSTRSEAFVQLTAVVGHWHLRGFGRWIVADRETDTPLGLVGLHHPQDWPEPEIGWTLFDGAEGRGIAAEAARAARRYAYHAAGWTTAVSLVGPGNERSAALARRIGCCREADFDHPVWGALQVWRHPGPHDLGGVA